MSEILGQTQVRLDNTEKAYANMIKRGEHYDP